jgi:Holliday junction resolvasome RuvABC endonuclease subunit
MNKDLKILALDQATVTGWATDTSSGIWNLKPNRGESEGMRVVRFKSKVREIIDMEQIGLVAYERPAGRFKASIMVSSEMIGVLKDLCIELGVELACYSATQIKAHATGKGNAKKDMMVSTAKKHFNIDIIDDNHADALWLLDLAKKDLGL